VSKGWGWTATLVALLAAWAVWAAEPLKCQECHEQSLAKSVHEGNLSCTDCHADVKSEEHAEQGAKPVDCRSCHEDQGGPQAKDVHARLASRVGDKGPTCAKCHGSHGVLAPAQVAEPAKQYCASCHEGRMQLAGSYHQPKLVPDQECLECHTDKPYPEHLGKSIHRDIACADCHSFAANNLDEHAEKTPFAQRASCSACHQDVVQTHRESIHGISLAEGIDEAANCWNCHGTHEIVAVADPTSSVHPTNLSHTCGKCHDDKAFQDKFSMGLRNIGSSYEASVHGRLTAEGDAKAANCVTCHGVHDIKNRAQPGSHISSFSVPDTCGQCHAEITAEYKQSIHWILAKRGIGESPVCNDCHNEHSVHTIAGQASRDELRRLQMDGCIRCHEDPVVARKFGLNKARPGEYMDSYHGLAVMRGDPDSAMCMDCHGVHKILPKSHPESLVHPDKVRETCAACHAGASDVFSQSYAHNAVVEQASRTVEYWVRQVYLWMIVLVIGGMIIHNLLILGYELHEHRKRNRGQVTLSRFTGNEVAQHLLLMLIFTLLALTGFALKYTDFPLFKLLTWAGMDEPVRQWLHRGLGVALVVLGVYHLIYLALAAEGRNLYRQMLPRLRDAKDMVHNILYHLKLRRVQPEFTHFNYIEKSEYWALIWGTIIMAVTGFVLWVPTIVGDWAPIWLIRVCEIIHFYEAVLATLAILVWHLFFVIYHPKEYPMNLAWIDGKISLEVFKHHYRDQYKQVVAEWHRHRLGLLAEQEMSYDTRRFMHTLRKHHQDPDEVLQREVAGEPDLQAMLADITPPAPPPEPTAPPTADK
jgi:predicted CXXCH cytochrome family protein